MNFQIKGNTSLYCVVGDPITHSISPEIHNSIFQGLEMNNTYIPMNIKSNELESGISILKNAFSGFNVTIPHKQGVMKYLDEVEKQAAIYGAVNTVKVMEGRLIGYNTDGFGFSKSLKVNNIDVKEKKILLLGAGGAARVVAYELIQKGAYLTIATRDEQKAIELIGNLEVSFGKGCSSCENMSSIKEQYFGVVNATPVGMTPKVNEIPVAEEVLKNVVFVFDLIYNPYKTKLLKKAEYYGAIGINGFAMLFYQAVKAQEIWGGQELSDDKTLSIYEEIEKYLKTKFE